MQKRLFALGTKTNVVIINATRRKIMTCPYSQQCIENEECLYDSEICRDNWRGCYTYQSNKRIDLQYGVDIEAIEIEEAKNGKTTL